MRRLRNGLFGFVLLALLLLAAYTWGVLHVPYSDGERAGVLQKLSHKGWLCKTWEGELLLTPLPGTVPEKFAFTVPDAAVAQALNAALGHRVVVSYSQHRGLPSSCFGDSEYFVESVRDQGSP